MLFCSKRLVRPTPAPSSPLQYSVCLNTESGARTLKFSVQPSVKMSVVAIVAALCAPTAVFAAPLVSPTVTGLNTLYDVTAPGILAPNPGQTSTSFSPAMPTRPGWQRRLSRFGRGPTALTRHARRPSRSPSAACWLRTGLPAATSLPRTTSDLGNVHVWRIAHRGPACRRRGRLLRRQRLDAPQRPQLVSYVYQDGAQILVGLAASMTPELP